MKKYFSLVLSLIMMVGMITSVPLSVVAAETTVYVTASGSKYHLSSACSNMKTPIAKTLSEAKTLGYEPCSKCVPDDFESEKNTPVKCSKPSLKKIENTAYGVKITWGKISGADKYYVYRKTSGGSYSRIGSTTNTYHTDKTASSGKKYYYIVKAVNEAGASSSSNSLYKFYLSDPTLNTPSSTTKGIGLKWTKSDGAQGYMVYRKEAGGSYEKIKTEKGEANLSYRDTTAEKGTKYYYKVKAYYSKTYSAYSNTKSITDKY